MRLGCAEVRFTARADGDFGDGAHPADRTAAQRRIVDLPWTTVHQVHGATVLRATRHPGSGVRDADAIVTAEAGLAIAVRTADCAPVALAADGVVGVVHAGWRGLVGGVVASAVAEMRAMGADEIAAALGPCIHAECYEFSPTDLDEVAGRLGATVRATTSHGRPALDVPAAVRAALADARVDLVHEEDVCTACSPRFWSHRARGDRQRQATVVWRT